MIREREVAVEEPEGFRAFVAARSPALVRTAFLLTGNLASAEDLVQVALMRTWSRWSQVIRQDAPEAYVRRVIITTYLSWRRRRWHGERPTGAVPDVAAADRFEQLDARTSIVAALLSLPPRQRAVVVLRYYDDLTEVQAADLLGCSVGTVKSQTAKAFAALRVHPQLSGLLESEATA